MTRTTRAALRSQEQGDESTTAASVPLPSTPQRERMPLGEISDNRGAEPVLTTITVNDPIKAAKKKGKHGKGTKKGAKKGKEDPEYNEINILEDDQKSTTSSAAEETRHQLAQDGPEGLPPHITI